MSGVYDGSKRVFFPVDIHFEVLEMDFAISGGILSFGCFLEIFMDLQDFFNSEFLIV